MGKVIALEGANSFLKEKTPFKRILLLRKTNKKEAAKRCHSFD